MTFLIPPPGVLLERTLLDSDAVAALNTVFNFTGLTFGDAASDRYLVAVLAATGDARSVSTCTIGGVTATKLAGNTGTRQSSIWAAVVPTGTTGDVSITVSATAAGAGIHLYSFRPFTPVNTANLTTNGGSLAIPDAGWAIGGGFDSQAGTPGVTLTGLTQDATITWSLSGLASRLSAGSVAGTGASPTLSVSGSSGGAYGFTVSAFGA